MAEIISSDKKRGNPRIDLTPMVDLGFLLITFFIFTTTLIEPRTMDIKMPFDGPETPIRHHTAMTIFLGKDHTAYYFTGTNAMNNEFGSLLKTGIDDHGIRNVLMQHALQVQRSFPSIKGSTDHDVPFVLIKASRESQYSDLVNLLDELMITQTDNYALMDISEEEENAIKQKG